MTDNELKLYVVLLVSLLIMWSFRFMRKNKMLESGNIYRKAEFAWKIYREANSLDQKLVAACIASSIMTFSIPKLVFGLLVVVSTVAIGGAFNNTVWQYLFDFARWVTQPFLPSQPPGHGAAGAAGMVPKLAGFSFRHSANRPSRR